MKNFKKVIAGLLAVLMLALSVNVSFAAEEYTEKEAVVVAKVSAAGIMTGTDKGFEPSKSLTRAEAAAIIVRMKGISEDAVKAMAGTTLFTDVPASHWASGYVNQASNLGIVKGVSATTFAPEKEVTIAEFVTMAIRALGAGQLVDSEGTWPTNYVNFANENDILKDVNNIYTAVATRMQAATIVANTLTAPMWEKTGVKSNGEISWTKSIVGYTEDDKDAIYRTILENVLKIQEVEGVKITGVETKDREAKFDKINSNKLTEVGPNANLASVKTGQTYTVWYDKDEKIVLGFWIPDDNEQIVFTEVKDFGDKLKLVVDGKEEKYTLADNVKYFLNGSETETTTTDLKKLVLPISGIATTDEEGDINFVYCESFEKFGIVKEVKNDKIYFETEDLAGVDKYFTKSTITLDFSKDSKKVYKVTKDGKEIDVKDLEAGDALYYYTDGTVYTMEVINDTVEGKVAASTDSKIEIDDNEYELYEDKLATVKNEGTFYLLNGKVTMWHKDKEDKGNFAVIGAARVVNGSSVGKYDFEVKLISLDGTEGEWTTVDLKETNKKLFGTEDADKDNYFTIYEGSGAKDIDAAEEYKPGHIVTYTTKSSKVVFTKDIDEVEFNAFTDASRDSISTADDKYFITSSTVVAELEADDDEVTLKLIDAADIDTIEAKPSVVLGTAADFDKNEVGIVIFAEDKSEVKTENKWAYVKEVVGCTRDDNEDIAYKVTVVYAGDSNKTTLYAKSTVGKDLDPEDMIGEVYNLAVTDKVITKASQKDLISNANGSDSFTDLDAVKYLYKEYGDNMRNFASATFTAATQADPANLAITESDYYVIADDVIVMKLSYKDTAVDKRDISDFDTIDELTQEDGDDTNVEADVDEIKQIWLEEIDDELVVIAITYVNNEKND